MPGASALQPVSSGSGVAVGSGGRVGAGTRVAVANADRGGGVGDGAVDGVPLACNCEQATVRNDRQSRIGIRLGRAKNVSLRNGSERTLRTWVQV
jgi:hypothetical protein